MRANDNGPMLNAYPDSVGGTLKDMITFLKRPELKLSLIHISGNMWAACPGRENLIWEIP